MIHLWFLPMLRHRYAFSSWSLPILQLFFLLSLILFCLLNWIERNCTVECSRSLFKLISLLHLSISVAISRSNHHKYATMSHPLTARGLRDSMASALLFRSISLPLSSYSTFNISFFRLIKLWARLSSTVVCMLFIRNLIVIVISHSLLSAEEVSCRSKELSLTLLIVGGGRARNTHCGKSDNTVDWNDPVCKLQQSECNSNLSLDRSLRSTRSPLSKISRGDFYFTFFCASKKIKANDMNSLLWCRLRRRVNGARLSLQTTAKNFSK